MLPMPVAPNSSSTMPFSLRGRIRPMSLLAAELSRASASSSRQIKCVAVAGVVSHAGSLAAGSPSPS